MAFPEWDENTIPVWRLKRSLMWHKRLYHSDCGLPERGVLKYATDGARNGDKSFN